MLTGVYLRCTLNIVNITERLSNVKIIKCSFKILGLTTSTNPNEAKAAEAKLEQQLAARGISREQLEQQLDMATVEQI